MLLTTFRRRSNTRISKTSIYPKTGTHLPKHRQLAQNNYAISCDPFLKPLCKYCIAQAHSQSPRLKRLCASDDIQSFILYVCLLNGLGPNVIVYLGVLFHNVAHFQETTYLFWHRYHATTRNWKIHYTPGAEKRNKSTGRKKRPRPVSISSSVTCSMPWVHGVLLLYM